MGTSALCGFLPLGEGEPRGGAQIGASPAWVVPRRRTASEHRGARYGAAGRQERQGRQGRGEDGQGQGPDERSRRRSNGRQGQKEGRSLGSEEGEGQAEEGRPQGPTLVDEEHLEGAGAAKSLGPSLCPYAAECVEYEFCGTSPLRSS